MPINNDSSPVTLTASPTRADVLAARSARRKNAKSAKEAKVSQKATQQSNTQSVALDTLHTPMRQAPGRNNIRDNATEREWAFDTIFGSKQQTRAFGEFIQNVHMQFDLDAFNEIVTSLRAESCGERPQYREFYPALKQALANAKGGMFKNLGKQLEALGVIQKTLADQATSLTAKGITVNNFVEMGYPGRLIRPFQKIGQFNITGKKYVVNDQESLGDLVQSGFPRPYDKFVPMSSKLSDSIPENSIDMFFYPVGMHHIPLEDLEDRIADIAKVLSPGGSLLLRDHDANDDTMRAMVHVVHSVFNAADGVETETEVNEVRHFRSMSDWADLLAKHGLVLVGKPIVTEGDPSRNALARFVKMPPEDDVDANIDALNRIARMSNPQYERAAGQTYATSAEWHLVHEAEALGNHLAARGAPGRYPWFKSIGTLWKVGQSSLREAKGIDGKGNVPFDYKAMNVFMMLTTTVELLYRGSLLAPLRLLGMDGGAHFKGAREFADLNVEYAEFITHTPFFQFPWLKSIGRMWGKAFTGGLQAPVNLYLALMCTFEFFAKAVVSAPLSAAYGGGDDAKLFAMVRDRENLVEGELGADSVKHTGPDGLKVVEVPRYGPFRELVKKFADSSIELISVAGQQRIQVKAKVAPGHTLDDAELPDSTKVLGEIPVHANPGEKYVRLDVNTQDLPRAVQAIDANAKVAIIHDF